MAKILFWNTQRYGKGTHPLIRDALLANGVALGAHLGIFCELTTTAEDVLDPQNQSYRKANRFQLCYGLYNYVTKKNLKLEKVVPACTDEYREAGYKGGNDFKRLADRALVSAGKWDGVSLYAIHAPASNNAVKVMSFIACHLNEFHGANPWVLIGDFNVTPEDLEKSKVAIDLSELMLIPPKGTHLKGKILDYVLTNKDNIVIGVADLKKDLSDHAPIWVEWG